MPNSSLAFGIDLSRWNTSADGKKLVNFDIIAAHEPKVCFIGMRAGISWGYQDPWYNYYFSEATRIQRVKMPYHVLFPGENPTRQMDNFFRIMGDEIDFDTCPLVLDLELDHGHTVHRITQASVDCLNIMHRRTGHSPIVYSRTSWLNHFVRVADFPPVYWWLAQYLWPRPFPLYTPEYPSPPNPLPRGVNQWHFHQTAERGKSIGAKAMHFMDYNRFNGTEQEFFEFIGFDPPTPITCPIDSMPCTGGKVVVES